jgi:hypothetical protein
MDSGSAGSEERQLAGSAESEGTHLELTIRGLPFLKVLTIKPSCSHP